VYPCLGSHSLPPLPTPCLSLAGISLNLGMHRGTNVAVRECQAHTVVMPPHSMLVGPGGRSVCCFGGRSLWRRADPGQPQVLDAPPLRGPRVRDVPHSPQMSCAIKVLGGLDAASMPLLSAYVVPWSLGFGVQGPSGKRYSGFASAGAKTSEGVRASTWGTPLWCCGFSAGASVRPRCALCTSRVCSCPCRRPHSKQLSTRPCAG